MACRLKKRKYRAKKKISRKKVTKKVQELQRIRKLKESKQSYRPKLKPKRRKK